MANGNSVIDQLRRARTVGVPVVGVTTADQPAFVRALSEAYQTASNVPPILQHDLIRGVVGVNDPGLAAASLLAPADDVMGPAAAVLQSPAEALGAAIQLGRRAILIVHNANALLENAAVVQAVCNLRDAYKADGRTLVLLDAGLTVPPVLAADIFTLEEALPGEAEIARIIDTELDNAQAMNPPPAMPDGDTKARATEALLGLSAFSIEQAVALSLVEGALKPPVLWTRKRRQVEQTRGLSMVVGGETFDAIGGMAAIKTFHAQLFGGPKRPRGIVFLDEMEKAMAGASGGDTSGVAQDAHGALLRSMEDEGWAGLIAVGPPGGGKSVFSKALGATFDVPTFAIDMGAAKGSLVGQSEERIRAILRIIKAVAADGAYFVGTCNKLDVLSPELRRRFKFGTWFFDLPDAEERLAIWAISLARFGLDLDAVGPYPRDDRWTGAEIRNCCELAWRLRTTLVDAARYIVPVSVADPAGIERLRQSAHTKFLSVSQPGFYVHAAAGFAGPPAAQGVQAFAMPGRAYGES